MRKTIVTISAISLLGLASAQPAFAAGKTSKEESIGVGTGAIIGAAAGGPVGFIIGAALGGKIGDTMHQKNTRIETLQDSLQTSTDTVSYLQRDVDSLAARIEQQQGQLQELSDSEFTNLLQAGIAMDLLFRTGEHVLTDTSGDRFYTLAQKIAELPDVQIQLDGFADERGDADYNLKLSERRVAFVRDQLVKAGVDAASIRQNAYGETAAQQDNEDSYALERRVSVTLYIDDAPSLAAMPY